MAIRGGMHTLITPTGRQEAALSGSVRPQGEPGIRPQVGDWVVYQQEETGPGILDILPRINTLSLQAPGTAPARQAMAANIDYAILVEAVDPDFNPDRLRQSLLHVQQGGILPIIILNKIDSVPKPGSYLRRIVEGDYQCPVHLACALDQERQERWADLWMRPGLTYLLLGARGAGKSTLLDAWLGNQRQEETVGSLMLLPCGSLIIETSGSTIIEKETPIASLQKASQQ